MNKNYHYQLSMFKLYRLNKTIHSEFSLVECIRIAFVMVNNPKMSTPRALNSLATKEV